MLDGMFSFCILDKEKNKIVLVRDRAGKKPLYIYKKDNCFLFSSELNAIKVAIDSVSINEDAIEAYLRCGFFYAQFTPYNDIETIQAGMMYEIHLETLDTKKRHYFNLMDFYQEKSNVTIEQSLMMCDEQLHKSVRNRLISSIEVGAFLSGGIDSSLIVALLRNIQKILKRLQ